MQNYHKEFLNKMAQIPGQLTIIKPRCNVDRLIDEARIVLNTALGIPNNLYSLKNPHLFKSGEVEQLKKELKNHMQEEKCKQ